MLFFGPDGGGASGEPAAPLSPGNGASAPQTPPAQPPQAQPPQAPPAAAKKGEGEDQYATSGNGRNVVLPQEAFKRIKKEAREKGQKEAVLAVAQELGFDSVEAMKVALLKARGSTKSETPEKPKPNGEQQSRNGQEAKGQAKWEREREKLMREKDSIARRMAEESKARKELQRALDAKEAEMALREVAFRTGIRDEAAVDVAVRLLTRQLEGKDEAALNQFDESKFFDGLKQSHPYLFGEVVRPANTGVGAGNAPPPPKPGAQAQQQANGNQVDARKMSKEEFNEYLRKRGLNASM